MQFSTKFSALVALAIAASTQAASLQLRSADTVYDPPIITPNAATVWVAGSTVNVTWDTSSIPPVISSSGLIELKTANFTSGFAFVTLAQGVDLRSGSQAITIPADAPSRTDYEIVLFGDSGNISPEFTIIQE